MRLSHVATVRVYSRSGAYFSTGDPGASERPNRLAARRIPPLPCRRAGPSRLRLRVINREPSLIVEERRSLINTSNLGMSDASLSVSGSLHSWNSSVLNSERKKKKKSLQERGRAGFPGCGPNTRLISLQFNSVLFVYYVIIILFFYRETVTKMRYSGNTKRCAGEKKKTPGPNPQKANNWGSTFQFYFYSNANLSAWQGPLTGGAPQDKALTAGSVWQPAQQAITSPWNRSHSLLGPSPSLANFSAKKHCKNQKTSPFKVFGS